MTADYNLHNSGKLCCLQGGKTGNCNLGNPAKDNVCRLGRQRTRPHITLASEDVYSLGRLLTDTYVTLASRVVHRLRGHSHIVQEHSHFGVEAVPGHFNAAVTAPVVRQVNSPTLCTLKVWRQ